MKTVGIIAEYNPFHNGHLYHLTKAREVSGADRVIVVMSGNFTQRGEPAVIGKYHRARMALECGADLVIELPVCYACSSAEYFAYGAVSLLNDMNVTDFLCFGSEFHDNHLFEEASRILLEEPPEYKKVLKTGLSEGLSFPAARESALMTELPHLPEKFLSSPNSILGIEYFKALKKKNSSIRPLILERKCCGYHDAALGNHYSSATAVRNSMNRGCFGDNAGINPLKLPEELRTQIPSLVWNQLQREYGHTCPVRSQDFSLLYPYKMLQATQPEDFFPYLDISEDLARRIFHLRLSFTTLEDFIQNVKTKQFTDTRIRRALLHMILDIKQEDLCKYLSFENCVPYIRVLGFRKKSSDLLTKIKKRSTLPILTKLSDASGILKNKSLPFAQKMLETDIKASHIYHSAAICSTSSAVYNEYLQQIICI